MTTAALDVNPKVREFLSASSKKMLIGGKWVESASGKTFPTHDPSNGEVLVQVAEGDVVDIDAAVSAARSAFEKGPWKTMSPSERGKFLNRVADSVEAHAEELAQLEVLDNGKTIREATKGDLPLPELPVLRELVHHSLELLFPLLLE